MSPEKALAWLRSYGFAALVLLALAGGAFLAFQTETPEPVPDFALQAQVIYRIEVLLASFLAFYVVFSLFVSALNGHGIAQLGAGGIRVQRIVNEKQQSMMMRIIRQDDSINTLRQAVEGKASLIQINELSERLRMLEESNARENPGASGRRERET